MVSLLNELKSNILKLILIVRFACATLDVGDHIGRKSCSLHSSSNIPIWQTPAGQIFARSFRCLDWWSYWGYHGSLPHGQLLKKGSTFKVSPRHKKLSKWGARNLSSVEMSDRVADRNPRQPTTFSIVTLPSNSGQIDLQSSPFTEQLKVRQWPESTAILPRPAASDTERITCFDLQLQAAAPRSSRQSTEVWKLKMAGTAQFSRMMTQRLRRIRTTRTTIAANPNNSNNDCGESDQLEQRLRPIRTTWATIAANPINLSNNCGQSDQLEQRLRPIRSTRTTIAANPINLINDWKLYPELNRHQLPLLPW
jgi:hypothetical protein